KRNVPTNTEKGRVGALRRPRHRQRRNRAWLAGGAASVPPAGRGRNSCAAERGADGAARRPYPGFKKAHSTSRVRTSRIFLSRRWRSRPIGPNARQYANAATPASTTDRIKLMGSTLGQPAKSQSNCANAGTNTGAMATGKSIWHITITIIAAAGILVGFIDPGAIR